MTDRRPTGIAGPEEPNPLNPARQLAVIWPLLGRHIAFHRRLVEVTSNVKAALLLSQAIYWTRHGRDIERSEGWFMKTVEQWELETGLTEREQATARALLRRLALLYERRVGVPARLQFRLDRERLAALLAQSAGRGLGVVDWADGIAVAHTLGPAVAYHRSLARLARGVHAGLLLSRALHLTRLQAVRRHDAWVMRTAIQWTEELGLTRREQDYARRDLLETGVWEESLFGLPARMGTRVRLDALMAHLAGADRVPLGSPAEVSRPECGDPSSRDAPNVGTSWRESRHLVPRKPPIQIRANRHHSSAETAILLIQGSTSVSVQPHHRSENAMTQSSDRRGGELIFPESLQPEERAAACLLVERCGDHAQALLDELSARIQSHAVRTPIAYLRGLVARAAAGTFVPEAGLRIAVARRRRAEEALERQQRAQEDLRLAAEQQDPEQLAKRAARREEIRQWLDRAKTRRQGGERP